MPSGTGYAAILYALCANNREISRRLRIPEAFLPFMGMGQTMRHTLVGRNKNHSRTDENPPSYRVVILNGVKDLRLPLRFDRKRLRCLFCFSLFKSAYNRRARAWRTAVRWQLSPQETPAMMFHTGRMLPGVYPHAPFRFSSKNPSSFLRERFFESS